MLSLVLLDIAIYLRPYNAIYLCAYKDNYNKSSTVEHKTVVGKNFGESMVSEF